MLYRDDNAFMNANIREELSLSGCQRGSWPALGLQEKCSCNIKGNDTSLNSSRTSLVTWMCSFLMCFIEMTTPLWMPTSEKSWAAPVAREGADLLWDCKRFHEEEEIVSWLIDTGAEACQVLLALIEKDIRRYRGKSLSADTSIAQNQGHKDLVY